MRCGSCNEVFDGNAALLEPLAIPQPVFAPVVSEAPYSPPQTFAPSDEVVAEQDTRAGDEPIYTLQLDSAVNQEADGGRFDEPVDGTGQEQAFTAEPEFGPGSGPSAAEWQPEPEPEPRVQQEPAPDLQPEPEHWFDLEVGLDLRRDRRLGLEPMFLFRLHVRRGFLRNDGPGFRLGLPFRRGWLCARPQFRLGGEGLLLNGLGHGLIEPSAIGLVHRAVELQGVDRFVAGAGILLGHNLIEGREGLGRGVGCFGHNRREHRLRDGERLEQSGVAVENFIAGATAHYAPT